jgi:ribosomal protein L35
MKTNKSFAKRIKLTKNGKIKARKAGGNHFNAKESRNKQLKRKRSQDVVISNKDKNKFLANM